MRERPHLRCGEDNLHVDGLRECGDYERVPALVCPEIQEM